MGKCEQCIIKQFRTMNVLSADELSRISNSKTSKSFKKGDVIFSEGEALNGVYCIRNGACKLSKLSANGRDQIVKLVLRGDMLGQRSVVCGENANLSAIALDDIDLCFIPKQEIEKNLSENHNFSLELLKLLALDLKTADNVIVDMAQKSVKQRLAETLIYIHDNFGIDEDGYLSVMLSREDYTSVVGTALESAIRTLSQFKKDGFISTSGKHIKIENLSGLGKVQ